MTEPITKTIVLIHAERGEVFQKWDNAYYVPEHAGSTREFRIMRTIEAPNMPKPWTSDVVLGHVSLSERHTIVEKYP